jgi:Acidic N-terminal SPT6
MNDFIADDEEVEAELMQAHHNEPKKHKNKKRRKIEHKPELDEEDVDLIRENVGIEVKKKNRLKRNATIEEPGNDKVKSEDRHRYEEIQIDTRTTKPMSQGPVVPSLKTKYENEKG